MDNQNYRHNIQPYPQETLHHPFLMYKAGMRRDILLIIIAIVVYTMVQSAIGSMISMLQMVSGGEFDTLTHSMAETYADSGAFDMWDYLNGVIEAMDSTPGGVALTQLVAVILSLPVFFMVAGKRWFTEYVPKVNRPMIFPDFGQLLLAALGANFLFTFVAWLLDMLLGLAGLSVTGSYETMMDPFMSPLGCLYVVLIGPISEELIFRGAIMRKLERHGANLAIVVSSAVFALFHMIIIQALFAFLAGLVLGYTARRYSLKWAILLHIIINGFSVALSLLFGDGIITTLIFAALFVGALAVIIVRRKYIKSEIVAGRAEYTMQFPEMLPMSPEGKPIASPYKIAFSCASMILFIVFTGIMGVFMIIAPLLTPGLH